MIKNILKKGLEFAKKEKRLCTAGVFVVLIFFLNQLIFSSQKITSEDCLTGECGIQETEKPQLSKTENIFYQDDILTDISSGYYRLTFQTKTENQDNILVKLNTYTEKNETIREVNLENSEKFENHEIFFFLPKGFDNLVFEKADSEKEGDIFIKGVGITRLNVDSPEEFALMRETIIGETNIDFDGLGQTEISSDSFPLLQEPDTRLGQIFEAETDYISGVSFNMDIIQDKSIKDEDYKIILQEVRCRQSDCELVGNNPSDKSFSIKDSLEKYQKKDGTFLFPLYANVEKGKTYFVSIDNSKVKVSRRNYLDLKGGRNDDAYANGSAGFRVKDNIYKIAGDLFFKVHGVNFDFRDGVRILNGAKIETLGKGQGKYTYVAKGEFVDILDLWSASSGTNFDDGRKVIVGNEKDSALVYEVNTIFPMEKVHFFAQQSKPSWKKVKVEYSFDRENWIEAPSLEKTEQELLSMNVDNNQNNEKNEDTNEIDLDRNTALMGGTTETNEGRIVYFRTTSDLEDLDNMEYSFDQENWEKASVFNKIKLGNIKDAQIYSVDKDALATDEDFFVAEEEKDEDKTQVFDFDVTIWNNKKTIYFKITPDSTDTAKSRYFSVKNLRITADLKIE